MLSHHHYQVHGHRRSDYADDVINKKGEGQTSVLILTGAGEKNSIALPQTRGE